MSSLKEAQLEKFRQVPWERFNSAGAMILRYDFGWVDGRRRRIGASSIVHPFRDGSEFLVYYFNTRDGNHFGSTSDEEVFETLEKAQAEGRLGLERLYDAFLVSSKRGAKATTKEPKKEEPKKLALTKGEAGVLIIALQELIANYGGTDNDVLFNKLVAFKG